MMHFRFWGCGKLNLHLLMKRIIVALVVAMVVCTSLYGQKKYGVVKYSVNFMRTYPDYESGLETQALMGTPVEILGRQGYWLQIRTPEPYVAWATDMGVVPMDSLQLQNYLAAPKYVCTSLWTEVYDSPESGAQRISDLVAGDIVRIKFDSRNRPLKHKLYLGIVLPDGRDAFVKYPDVVRFSDWAASRRATPANVVATAKRFLGTPYLWGGTSSKGLDCSGLTRTAFFLNGVLLYRNASQQVKEGIEVSLNGFVPGKCEGDLKPGDLMFFGRKATEDSPEKVTHVAMYIGGGRIIHSSHEVRINSLDPSAPDYYSGAKRLLRARRMCDENGTPYTSTLLRNSPAYFPSK